MRVGKLLLILTAAAFFLLLLSALIVTPASDALPNGAPASPSDMSARFAPYIIPAPDTALNRTNRLPTARVVLLPLIALLAIGLCFKSGRDANGRVLSAKRYENSFYPVFRQEIAGG